MYSENLNKVGLLDEFRLKHGADNLREYFHGLVRKDKDQAIKLVNDENLLYPTLFILQPEIRRFDLFTQLNIRNIQAIKLVYSTKISENREDNHSVLKWILETGYKEDGLNDRYDEVMDTAAIILTKVFRDLSCLPAIEELIFNRNRKGTFTHDLIWAFFEVEDPRVITMVTNRLQSSEQKDIELAREFLNFIPCITENSENDPIKQHECALKWINENQNYMYYTGETCQQASNPCRYAISLEAKYLQRSVKDVQEGQSRSLDDYESRSLDNFMKLDDYSKSMLSKCSEILYKRSKYNWNKWLQNPIDKQLAVARRMLGGSQ